MSRWLVICGVVGGIIAAIAVWNLGPSDKGTKAGERNSGEQTSSPPPDIGQRLEPVKLQNAPRQRVVPEGMEPIIIPDCRLAPINTQEVPSQREGKLLLIGTEVDSALSTQLEDKFRQYLPKQRQDFLLEREKAGYIRVAVTLLVRPKSPNEYVPPEERVYNLEDDKEAKKRAVDYRVVQPEDFVKPNEARAITTGKWYRELKEGTPVKKGQLLAMVDPALAIDEVLNKASTLDAKEADREATEKTRDEALQRKKSVERAHREGAASLEEVRGAELTYLRYKLEEIGKGGAVRVATVELRQSLTLLRMHEIRSEVDGVIKAVYKKRGESVRSLESVLQVQDLSDLRLEGMVEVQYRDPLYKNPRVMVEPSVQDKPDYILRGHTQEITAVAVANNAGESLIVSASEDGTLRVWDRAKKQRDQRQYTAPLRSVACTPAASKANLCLFGAADGTARLWDLEKASRAWKDGKRADEDPKEAPQKHKGPVTCVAFSLDGKYFATGGEDRNIYLYETDGLSLKYAFPAGHKGGVTSLQFTPGNQVVSAGKDNAILVWTLGTKGARVEKTDSPRRGGEVAVLGISPDGEQVLFDRGRELRLLSLDGWREEGRLVNPAGTPNFTTLALYSPDGRLALTASGSEGRLQLWRLPAASLQGDNKTVYTRAYEIRSLPWTSSANTCGAFCPRCESGQGFVVTGTREGSVLVWPLPPEKELEKQLEGEVQLAENIVDPSGKVRIKVKVLQGPDRPPLVSGNTGTIVAYPQQPSPGDAR